MKIRILLLSLCLTQGLAAQPSLKGDCSHLRDADLLFFAPGKGNAITDVTSGFAGRGIDHVAIFVRIGGTPCTLEATHRGVIVQPMDSTIARHERRNEQVYVGRVRKGLDIPASLGNALRYLGKPYDFFFEPGDSALYCSELVQKSYCDKRGAAVFAPIPMSFHNDKGEITEYWKAYYRKAGRQVPEGAPGSNPGQLSRSKRIRILYQLF
ncbi:YiiX/YebB-like N1pC/P60 family cysteine hydrolase [Prevotella sp. KH2C16]|uniref:YiiX/YebB-like N1pC/P60 family cysteine hydrolase n=1 Tax=Prevotella sp. KH2C16 TaxID=1855325 RepID=UPI0008E8DBCB|nr:YiiX/YebB-like N1pC/P60 family cysteine hydrolase [Prevotella sp. KH2C16]SFG41188.1 Permuted papain-like amidase enzyme, YaeF/YiiX, C92 family [Prevotella sp. KH2C16]